MKTRRHIFGGLVLAAAALVCLTGCKKDDEGEKITLGVDFEQTAGTQKTYIGNGEKTIYWSTDDQVQVNDAVYTVHDGVVEVNMCEDGYAAVYPATNTLTYSSETHSGKTCIGGEVVIPATQNYTTDVNTGVQKLNAPMAARLDSKTGRLLFRNLYAVIKVTVTAGSTPFILSSITVESTNSVNLAGTQAFSFSSATNTATPTLGSLSNGSKSVTLNFNEPIAIPQGETKDFYLYTVPFSGANLTIRVNYIMTDKEQHSRDDVSISRSQLRSTTVNVTDLTNIEGCVDLGLSVLWATCNVGADKPEESGDYFAWGETETYYSSLNPLAWKSGKENGHDFVGLSYTYFNGSIEVGTQPYDATTKFLKSENDVASVKLGGNWRMPTEAEFGELVNNCTWTWQDNYNSSGKSGYLVKSNKNGYTDQSIFIPAAGNIEAKAINNLTQGFYWSSLRSSDNIGKSYALVIGSGNEHSRTPILRSNGLSVRPVMPK